MAVVDGVTLNNADSMGVVTSGAGDVLLDYMFIVDLIIRAQDIAVDDARAIVAFITKGVGKRVFGSVVSGLVIAFQQKFVI